MSHSPSRHENSTLYENVLSSPAPSSSSRPPKSSGAIVPWRRTDGEIEVYWIHRSPKLRFMGGWHAFPGGAVSREDADAPLDGLSGDESERRDAPREVVTGAVRELFEETGLLLAPGAEELPEETLSEARRRLLAEEIAWTPLLEELALRPDASSLVFAGRWLTPPLAPRRFDNRFFLLEWPAERKIQPSIVEGELVDGEWIRPADASARWERAEIIAAPPILHLLRVLGDDGPQGGPEKGLPRLLDTSETYLGKLRRIEFRPGVVLLPLRTPTLPPATHTNAYLLGREEAVLIDPAPPFADEQDVLIAAVDAERERGKKIRAIWLTHHHSDHVGAVERLRTHLGVPVAAHAETAARLPGLVDEFLDDDLRVDLGGFPVRVLHTPGHARGHLCFYDETHGSLIAGDLLSALSTVIIDPPEGDMQQYFDSLDRMIELAPRTLFPAHGPTLIQGLKVLERLKKHRLRREEKIVDAWNDGLRTPEAMVARVYDDAPSILYPLAQRQILAHLDRLKLKSR